MYNSIEEVVQANKELGKYWFSADTMRGFRTRIESEVLFGCFFITSEAPDKLSRRFSIRFADTFGDVTTTGRFREYNDLDSALSGLDDYIASLHFDYFNSFLTVEKFAEHYGLSIGSAYKIIDHGRSLNEE